jgi:hypothetical protein
MDLHCLGFLPDIDHVLGLVETPRYSKSRLDFAMRDLEQSFLVVDVAISDVNVHTTMLEKVELIYPVNGRPDLRRVLVPLLK